MITPSYSPTATERVLPRLALDFTTASLDPRVTVSRALNTATRVNSSGYIETVNADLPRFDYSPSSVGVCNGLLIEETRTNLCLYSTDFTVATWSKNNVTVTPDAIAAPDGTVTADKIQCTGGGAYLLQSITATSTSHTYTIYAKQGSAVTEAHRFMVRNNTTGTNLVAIFINYSTGAVTYTTGSTGATTTDAGNGWWRVTITVTSGVSIGDAIYVYGGFIATGISGQFFYAWGAQFEAGAFSTSYIPTTSGTVQRNADVVTMTGTNFSSWWMATTGAAAVKYVPSTILSTRPIVQFDDSTANNIIALRGNTADPELYIKATTDQATIDAGTIAANTTYSFVGAWATDNCAAALNAGTIGTDTSVTIPLATQARLGSDGTNYLNGRLQTLRYWPQRIINAEVQTFSKV